MASAMGMRSAAAEAAAAAAASMAFEAFSLARLFWNHVCTRAGSRPMAIPSLRYPSPPGWRSCAYARSSASCCSAEYLVRRRASIFDSRARPLTAADALLVGCSRRDCGDVVLAPHGVSPHGSSLCAGGGCSGPSSTAAPWLAFVAFAALPLPAPPPLSGGGAEATALSRMLLFFVLTPLVALPPGTTTGLSCGAISLT